MNGKYLLDTNIIIALFAKDPQIHARIVKAEEIFIPSIALGELYFGAYKSTKIEDNLNRIDDFAHNSAVLACDNEIAKKYGSIKKWLKDKGQLIPENDMWIAAIAQQYGLTLVSNDSHFDVIENMSVERW